MSLSTCTREIEALSKTHRLVDLKISSETATATCMYNMNILELKKRK